MKKSYQRSVKCEWILRLSIRILVVGNLHEFSLPLVVGLVIEKKIFKGTVRIMQQIK